jgi:hypothetical protein
LAATDECAPPPIAPAEGTTPEPADDACPADEDTEGVESTGGAGSDVQRATVDEDETPVTEPDEQEDEVATETPVEDTTEAPTETPQVDDAQQADTAAGCGQPICPIGQTPESAGEAETGPAGPDASDEAPEATEESSAPEVTMEVEGDNGQSGDVPAEFDVIVPASGWVTTPPGPLVVTASGVVVAVNGDGDQLALATFGGGDLHRIGQAYYPIVLPETDQVLVGFNGGGSELSVGQWSPATGLVQLTEQDPNGPVYRDVPAGWENGVAYYERTYKDGSGRVELRRVVEGEDEVVWSRDGVSVLTRHPIPISAGFLIATSDGWLLIGADGSEQNLGGGVTGEVSAYAVTESGGLIAYASGGSLYVAPLGAPGAVQASIPFAGGPGTGFDFAPGGAYLSVGDGGDLVIYDPTGNAVTSVPSPDGGFGGTYWLSDGIRAASGGQIVLVPASALPPI